MAQLFANNAVGFLNSSITDTQTTLDLQATQGTLFPSIGGAADYFMITMYSKINGVEYNHEILKVTGKSGDTLTVVRGQEGTSGRAWSSGTAIECRVTAQSLSIVSATALFMTPPKTISTTTYSVLPSDISLVFTNINCTVTLPSVSQNAGRTLFVRNKNVYTDYGPSQESSIISASTNVLSLNSTVAGTDILVAGAGKYSILQSDGTNWVVIAGN